MKEINNIIIDVQNNEQKKLELYNLVAEYYTCYLVRTHGIGAKKDIEELKQELYIWYDYSIKHFDKTKGTYQNYLYGSIFPLTTSKYYEQRHGISKYHKKNGHEQITITDQQPSQSQQPEQYDIVDYIIKKEQIKKILSPVEETILFLRLNGFSFAHIAKTVQIGGKYISAEYMRQKINKIIKKCTT